MAYDTAVSTHCTPAQKTLIKAPEGGGGGGTRGEGGEGGGEARRGLVPCREQEPGDGPEEFHVGGGRQREHRHAGECAGEPRPVGRHEAQEAEVGAQSASILLLDALHLSLGAPLL